MKILWTIIRLLPTIIAIVKEIYQAINKLPKSQQEIELLKVRRGVGRELDQAAKYHATKKL